MKKYTILFVYLLFCTQLETLAQAQVRANTLNGDRADALMLVVTAVALEDKTIKLSYEVTNKSTQDVWICENIAQGCSFEVYPDDDGETLVIRRRLNVPTSFEFMARPVGKYVRLGAGLERNESLLLDVPVNSVHVYSEPGTDGVVNATATRLSIEIGYYVGNLPEMFLAMAERGVKSATGELSVPSVRLGAAVAFNELNESLNRRDEEVLTIYGEFQGEQVSAATIGDLSIPYRWTVTEGSQHTPPDLTACTRVEVQYEPSLLEYFYPYKSQQRLLNEKETEFLQSQNGIVTDSPKSISDFAKELRKASRANGGIVSEKSRANVVVYRDSGRAASFVVYDVATVETEKNQRIKYTDELQSLRMLTRQIQPFELRMQCGANLKNLWYRLRFYDRAEKRRVQSLSSFKLEYRSKLGVPRETRNTMPGADKNKEVPRREAEAPSKSREEDEELYVRINSVYPAPRRWCDALEWAHVGRGKGPWHESKMKTHVCPGVSEGRSTYAVNPRCKYDSPPDMVLLFETRDGWNQHGGPELFTFDNHDPRGGCVLLNDGTVKFIRTDEELQQLRWK